MINPILRWLGNKKGILNLLLENFPSSCGNYYEPFIGSGVLFFNLNMKNKMMLDINKDLINFYEVLKNENREFIDELINLEEIYDPNSKELYNILLNLDKNEENFKNLTSVQKAIRFYFLNKKSYMGLVKYDINGKAFSSYSKRANFKPNYQEIINYKEYLKNAYIVNSDFNSIRSYLKKNDMVYFDPPYDEVKSFKYNEKPFSKEKQVELAELCRYIDSIGANFMLSNSNTMLIRTLYSEFKIKKIRLENGREELLIKNY